MTTKILDGAEAHKCDPTGVIIPVLKTLMCSDAAVRAKASADFECPQCKRRWLVFALKPIGTSKVAISAYRSHWWSRRLRRWAQAQS